MFKDLIYFIEDEENIRDLIYCTLTAAGFDARPFERSGPFFEALSDTVPDLILLDIMLPDEDGHEILRQLKRSPIFHNIPVIFLTAKSAEPDKVQGLDGGADDYITKPFRVLEFISRVNAVLRRYKNTAQPQSDISDIAAYKDLIICKPSREVKKGAYTLPLTYKEYELFTLLLGNSGIVLSRDTLLNSVWGFDFEGETRTVDMHIKSLRQKLGDSADNPKYIKTVRGHGYMLIR